MYEGMDQRCCRVLVLEDFESLLTASFVSLALQTSFLTFPGREMGQNSHGNSVTKSAVTLELESWSSFQMLGGDLEPARP